jgi:hypothetical protein
MLLCNSLWIRSLSPCSILLFFTLCGLGPWSSCSKLLCNPLWIRSLSPCSILSFFTLCGLRPWSSCSMLLCNPLWIRFLSPCCILLCNPLWIRSLSLCSILSFFTLCGLRPWSSCSISLFFYPLWIGYLIILYYVINMLPFVDWVLDHLVLATLDLHHVISVLLTRLNL